MNATDIKEHREERPRFHASIVYDTQYGIWHWYGDLEEEPFKPAVDCITFTIPSAAEQRLMEEREELVKSIVAAVFVGHPSATDHAISIRTIDRQLAELRGAK